MGRKKEKPLRIRLLEHLIRKKNPKKKKQLEERLSILSKGTNSLITVYNKFDPEYQKKVLKYLLFCLIFIKKEVEKNESLALLIRDSESIENYRNFKSLLDVQIELFNYKLQRAKLSGVKQIGDRNLDKIWNSIRNNIDKY